MLERRLFGLGKRWYKHPALSRIMTELLQHYWETARAGINLNDVFERGPMPRYGLQLLCAGGSKDLGLLGPFVYVSNICPSERRPGTMNGTF